MNKKTAIQNLTKEVQTPLGNLILCGIILQNGDTLDTDRNFACCFYNNGKREILLNTEVIPLEIPKEIILVLNKTAQEITEEDSSNLKGYIKDMKGKVAEDIKNKFCVEYSEAVSEMVIEKMIENP